MVVYICNLYMKKNYFLLPITHSKIGCVLVLATNIGRHNDERGICVFNLYVHPVHRRTGRGLVEVGCIPGAMHLDARRTERRGWCAVLTVRRNP